MRKVLSFVLVLSLVLGSFSMAFAATPATGLSDIDGIANEDAIQVAYDLGIVTGNPDGTFLPEKAVNRAEFAAMITRALAIPESALAGYTTTKFKDTAGYGWAVPYLAFAESKGIMLGDGNGNAMPGRTINTNEAMTMVLRAIGYTNNSAELVGTWPSNYVTKAQELKLYDDVAAVVNVDKANAAQVIYNVLDEQKVAVNSDGETVKSWDVAPTNLVVGVPTTLLSSGLNCEATPGVIGASISNDSIINVQKYLGQYGTAYINSDDEIVAFTPESTQLVGKFATGVTTVGGIFKVGTVEYKYALAPGTTAYTTAVFNNGDFTGTMTANNEFVINVKVSGKTISQYYSVMDWSVAIDKKVTASDIKDIEQDKSLLGIKFTQDDDKNIDLNSFDLVGAKSLNDIEAGNVVYVYAANNKITKVEVGTAVVEGTVEGFLAGTTDTATIGTKDYKNASQKVNGMSISTNDKPIAVGDVGSDVKVYLDAKGYIYTFDALDGGAKNIAVIQKQADGITNQVKIFTAAGSSEVHAYDNSKLVINGTGTASEGAIIGYGLNKDGKITSANVNHVGNIIAPINLIAKSNTVFNVDGTDRVVASDVVVFALKDDGSFIVTSIDKVEKDAVNPITGSALLNNSNKVIGILVNAADANAASDDVYAVINELHSANLDGDVVNRIVGFADGSSVDKKADSEYITSLVAPSTSTDPALFASGVAIYKIEYDADGIITGISAPMLANASFTSPDNSTTGLAITAADGRNSVSVSTTIYPLASDVVVYEVNDDGEYAVYTGGFKNKDVVVLYELDDKTDGYELVILNRADR